MFDNNRLWRQRVGLCSFHIITWAAIVALTLIPGLPMAGISGTAQAQDWILPLTWTAPGDDGNIGTAAEYDIRYSTSPINESNWAQATPANGEPNPKAAGTTQWFTVTGLQASTLYYMAIKTRDEAYNWSSLSNVVSKSTTFGTGIDDDGGIKAEAAELSQNYPNPFNPGTMIECTLPSVSRLSLSVYNLLGQKVVTLIDGVVSAGPHQYRWNGTDRWGNPVASGVYFYRMTAVNFSQSRQMTLLR